MQSRKPKAKTTDGLAMLIIIALLAAGVTYKVYYRIFPPTPAVPPPVEVAPYVPAPPQVWPKEPPSEMRVVEPPPLPPGDDGAEEKLRDVSWVSFGSGAGVRSNVHSAYTNRFYAYSLGYDIGSTIAMPPRDANSVRVNTAGKEVRGMTLLIEDLTDPARLHLRQLFYDGYGVAVGARKHMRANAICDKDGCYLVLVEK